MRRLAEELQHEGHAVSYQTVGELLHALGYSLQANQKTVEGNQHADRDEQFEYINRKAQRYLKQGEPVISVDTKKKELVGDFKNAGREWELQGQPEAVRVHDFEIREPDKGKVAPYGSDLGRNVGWVERGSGPRHGGLCGRKHSPLVALDGHSPIYSETPIDYRRFRRQQRRTGEAVEVGIAETGRRNRAGDFGLSLPAGHEQVEQIEHRLFSFISQELAGKPLISHEVIINLIAATTTTTGLAVKSKLDTNTYPAGLKVSDQQMANSNSGETRFHGDWN